MGCRNNRTSLASSPLGKESHWLQKCVCLCLASHAIQERELGPTARLGSVSCLSCLSCSFLLSYLIYTFYSVDRERRRRVGGKRNRRIRGTDKSLASFPCVLTQEIDLANYPASDVISTERVHRDRTLHPYSSFGYMNPHKLLRRVNLTLFKWHRNAYTVVDEETAVGLP